MKGYDIGVEQAIVYQKETEYGWMSVVLVLTPENLIKKLIINVGKSGYEVQANAEGIARMASLGLEKGVDIADILKQLRGIVSSERGSVASYVVEMLECHLERTGGKE